MKKRITALALALALCLPTGVLAQVLVVQTQAESAVTLASVSDSDAISLSKTISASADENGEYTITLEAYTTGTVTTGESANPVDIVLVLDQSGSMICDFEGNSTTVTEDTIQYALKNAVTNFVESVHENAVEYGLNHRVSVVTFHSSAKVEAYLTDVESVTGYNSIQSTISGLSDDLLYQTYTHEGMALASLMYTLDDYEGTEERDKVIVLFSDGQPSATDYADSAIATAYTLKNTEGVEIYAIGTFDGADPSVITGADTAKVGASWTVTSKISDATLANRFMNYLSSNSSDAQEMGVNFTTTASGITCKISTKYSWENKGYYLTADGYEELEQMFSTVSDSVMVEAPSLDETGQLKDFLSSYFAFPDDFTSSDITLQIAACTGVDDTGAYQWAEPTTLGADSGVTASYQAAEKSISVTGFDYAQNVVTQSTKSDTEADYGAKLIVSFTVKAEDGFLGGNQVVSNTSDSGIYTAQEELIKPFDVPNTDVTLQSLSIAASDYSIYLGNAVNSGDAIALENNPFDGVNNAYVDAEIAIYWDENGNGCIDESERTDFESVTVYAGQSVSTLAFSKALSPTANAQYLIEVSLTPIYDGTQTMQSEVADDFAIYVKTPCVSTQDVWVDYGVDVALSQYCVQSVQWQYATGTPADAPAPLTDEPEVFLVYTQALESDVYTATSEKTFVVQGAQWVSTDGNDTIMQTLFADEAQSSFTVHLNTCNLTITKTVDAQTLALYPQTFFFTVVQGDASFIVSMTAEELATGTCTKSVVGLYAGQSISVSEDGAWAWRYTADALPVEVLYCNMQADGVTPLISSNAVPVGEESLAVKNTLSQSYWLATEQTAVNCFDGEGDCT